jgi:hypothetical protein
VDAFTFNLDKEVIMKSRRKILTIGLAMLMLSAGFVHEASGQVRRVIRRPVIVRQYVYRDPFWRARYYDPYYYDPYYYSPYLSYQDQKYRAEQEVAGNRRELNEHLRKYRADGVITAKEQRELNDDYKDVRESTLRLRNFSRYY